MAKNLDYVKTPLEAQPRSGVRSIEIDLQLAPKDGDMRNASISIHRNASDSRCPWNALAVTNGSIWQWLSPSRSKQTDNDQDESRGHKPVDERQCDALCVRQGLSQPRGMPS